MEHPAPSARATPPDVPPRGRAWGFVLLAVLLACAVLAVAGRKLPAALPESAPATEFSAARALAVLREVAREPHPAQTDANRRVRAALVERLRGLGLEPELQQGTVRGVELANVLVRIPGSAPTGTLLCLAHFDSVPTGPGAGDDANGVAAWVEAFRTLRARGFAPANDVVLLLTDGEEHGLLGARLFAAEHPLAASVACVVNLEGIGNGGPALLFQLGPRNGACVRAFAEAVSAPAGTSLGDAVYRRMPNDTDLTVFLRAGVQGFNFAILCGRAAYHAPHDTPENLDPRSLQHMGETALELTAHLAHADLTALRAGDATFFDVLGRACVRYPAWWDRVLAALAVAGALAWTWRTRARSALATSLALHLAELAALALATGLAVRALDRAFLAATPDQGWAAGNTTSAALLFLALVLLAAAAELVLPSTRAADGTARRQAVLLSWSALAVASLWLLGGASFALVLPLLLAQLGASLFRPGSFASELAGAVAFAAALLLALPMLHLVFQLFGTAPALASTVLCATLSAGAALFAPQLARIRRDVPWASRALFAASALLAVGSLTVAHALAWRQGALWP